MAKFWAISMQIIIWANVYWYLSGKVAWWPESNKIDDKNHDKIGAKPSILWNRKENDETMLS